MSEKPMIPGVNIEINGKAVKAELGQMIIEVADAMGETIPRFCYHKKLKIAANCRMCLVEIEGGRKPMPACATPVTEGMKVLTKSPKALEYQKTVMEFLLANHPLDCPVCDQGGECELQDNAMAYGRQESRFNLDKRAVADKDIGPLIATEFTRCIHCTRCVRFGVEVAGEPELGMMNRGEHSEIATFMASAVNNELSGNVIDLCPVGALTNKDARFKARPWELKQMSTVAGHDCLGSNTYTHVRRGTGIRVVPRENVRLNEGWISDRDRYSIAALNSPERLLEPKIKDKQGQWQSVDWTTALSEVVARFNREVKALSNAGKTADESVGLLLSPNSTLEEAHLAQKWMRSFGADKIDYRLRRESFETHQNALLGLDLDLSEIAASDMVFFFGGNLRNDQPILHERIRYASRYGAKIAILNPADFDFRMKKPPLFQCVEIENIPTRIAGIVKAAIARLNAQESLKPALLELLDTLDAPTAEDFSICDALLSAKSPVILSGLIVEQHPEAALIHHLQQVLMGLVKAKGGALSFGANALGCHLANAFSETSNAKEMLKEGLSVYFLMNVEPEVDSAYGAYALENLKKANLVVAFTSFCSEAMSDYADILLPIDTVFENEGTFINASKMTQTFSQACQSPGESKPLWKVIRTLAGLMELKGFEHDALAQVRAECERDIQHREMNALDAGYRIPKKFQRFSALKPQELRCCSIVPIYQVDPMVRRALPLQKTHTAFKAAHARISEKMGETLGVKTGDSVMLTQTVQGQKHVARVFVEVGGVADHTLVLPMGIEETREIFEGFAQVMIQKG